MSQSAALKAAPDAETAPRLDAPYGAFKESLGLPPLVLAAINALSAAFLTALYIPLALVMALSDRVMMLSFGQYYIYNKSWCVFFPASRAPRQRFLSCVSKTILKNALSRSKIGFFRRTTRAASFPICRLFVLFGLFACDLRVAGKIRASKANCCKSTRKTMC